MGLLDPRHGADLQLGGLQGFPEDSAKVTIFKTKGAIRVNGRWVLQAIIPGRVESLRSLRQVNRVVLRTVPPDRRQGEPFQR